MNNDLATGPVENVPANFNQSVLTGSPVEKESIFKRLGFLKWVILALVVLLVGIGGTWGYTQYAFYYQETSLEELLPADANLVAKITINPDSNQFQLLEQQMNKFPGYELLKKKLNEEKEGKDLSEVMQNKLKEKGLDFQQDIKPVIGDKAYFIVPDLSPLGKDFTKELNSLTQGKLESQLAGLAGPQESVIISQSAETRVLGEVAPEASDKINKKEEKEKRKPLDFIAASEIKDLKKAQEVLEKLKKDEKYEVTDLSYEGIKYYKVKLKSKGKDKKKDKDEDEFSSDEPLINTDSTYNALIGKNIVLTSSEGDLKKIIEQKKASSSLFGSKQTPTLKDDASYQQVMTGLDDQGEENILSFYTKVNSEKFFKPDCKKEDPGYCSDFWETFKYPENLIAGFLLKINEEGIVIRSVSNRFNFSESAAQSLKPNLDQKFPQKLNAKWGDFYLHFSGLKETYYDFKKNNLTQKGQQELNNEILETEKEMGLNWEKDFLDQIDGNVALAGFTRFNQEPEGALVTQVADPVKFLETMKKIIEFQKQTYLKIYTLKPTNSSAYQSSPEYLEYQKKFQERNQAKIDAISQAQIVESDTANGKVYSFQMPDLFSISFAFSDKFFILGAKPATVEAMLGQLKNDSAEKLAASENYKKSSQFAFDNQRGNVFVSTQGLYNAIYYYLMKFSTTSTFKDGQVSPEVQARYDAYRKSMEDRYFAYGAILRTIKVIGISYAVEGEMAKNSFFLNIVELPKEEKDRANSILEGEIKQMEGAKERSLNAQASSILASVSPVVAMCVNDGGRVNPAKEGQPICSGSSDIIEPWPTLPKDMKDAGYAYGKADKETITMTKDGDVIASCNVSTGSCTK